MKKITTEQVKKIHENIDKGQWVEGLTGDEVTVFIAYLEADMGDTIFSVYDWEECESIIFKDNLSIPTAYTCISKGEL